MSSSTTPVAAIAAAGTPTATPSSPFTLDHALSRASNDRVGPFHYQLLALCGWCNASDAVEILAVSFLLPAATTDLHLTDTDKGVLSAIIFLGMMIGGIVWGHLADVYGRRRCLLVSLLVNAIGGLFAAVAPNTATLIACRFVAGVGVGGSIPVIFTYVVEFLHREIRGGFMVYVAWFWMVGAVVTTAMAWIVIPMPISFSLFGMQCHSWRVFTFLASLPALICALLLFSCPESPQYLLHVGRTADAHRVLIDMFRINHSRRRSLRWFGLCTMGLGCCGGARNKRRQRGGGGGRVVTSDGDAFVAVSTVIPTSIDRSHSRSGSASGSGSDVEDEMMREEDYDEWIDESGDSADSLAQDSDEQSERADLLRSRSDVSRSTPPSPSASASAKADGSNRSSLDDAAAAGVTEYRAAGRSLGHKIDEYRVLLRALEYDRSVETLSGDPHAEAALAQAAAVKRRRGSKGGSGVGETQCELSDSHSFTWESLARDHSQQEKLALSSPSPSSSSHTSSPSSSSSSSTASAPAKSWKDAALEAWYQVRRLLRPPLAVSVGQLCLIWFCLSFGYYGLTLWIPEYVDRLHDSDDGGSSGSGSSNGGDDSTDASSADSTMYITSFISAAANLPGNMWSVYSVSRFGRRWTLVSSLAASAVAVLLVPIVTVTLASDADETTASSLVTAALAVFAIVSTGAWNALNISSAELFPTALRSTAFGLCAAVGRVGAILGNLLFGVLIGVHMAVPVAIVAISLVAASAASWRLRETKDEVLK